MNLRAIRLYEASSGPELKGEHDGDVLTWDAATESWTPTPTAPGGVTSVFGRLGAVTAQGGDYLASQIANDSGVAGASVRLALDNLAAEIAAIPSGVTSFNSRAGAVVPAANDYSASQVSNNSGVAGATVAAALNTLAAGTGVTSFNTRAGAVVPATNDYTIAQLGGTFAGQLGGSATAATVLGLRETSGPTSLTYGAIADAQFLRRVGTTVVGVTVQLLTPPVNPTDDGKVPIASAGNFSYLAGTVAGQALTWTGSAWAAPTVFLSIGATPSTQGTLRMTGDTNITSKDGTNERLLIGTIAVSSALSINDTSIAGSLPGVTQFGSVNVGWAAGGNFTLLQAGTTRFRVSSTIVLLGLDTLQFDATLVTTVKIIQGSTGGNVPRSMLMQAQSTTSTGTVTPNFLTLAGGDNSAVPVGTAQAGHIWTRGGAATGGSGTRVAGNNYQSGGHVGGGGGTTVGAFIIGAGDNADPTLQTVRLKVDGTGLGLYTAAPVAQQTRVGQGTNGTGVAATNQTLADVTTTGIADPVKVNQNFANLLVNIVNLIETRIHNIGLTA